MPHHLQFCIIIISLFNCVFFFLLQEGTVVVVADSTGDQLAFWRLRDGTNWKHIGSRGTTPGKFDHPEAIALTSSGELVVADHHRVQVLTVEGAVLCVLDPTAVAGVGRLGTHLRSVALFPGTDEILVVDPDNHRIVALTWTRPCHVRFSSFFFVCVCVCVHVLFVFISYSYHQYNNYLCNIYIYSIFRMHRAPCWMRGPGEVTVSNWDNFQIHVVLR
jgi:hypothetical protein